MCQGNGAGPTIWLAVSILLVINMIRSKGHKAIVSSPMSNLNTDLVAMIYVYDCHLIKFDQTGRTPHATIQKLQHNMCTWKKGLEVTGGSLSIYKCSCCFYGMTKQQGKWHSLT
jgi:hypothetical protein